MLRIALDAMGGDHGAIVVVPAALAAVARTDALQIVLVGDAKQLNQALSAQRSGYDASRVQIVHASQQVAMAEAPAHALRNKRDSSMRVAIDLVRAGEAQACVSAGNTGALMAMARFALKTLPGIDRPAIVSQLPCIGGHTHVLDLGANIDTSPEQLFQFAVMGSVLAHAVDNIERPTVGLLNIGEETIKGNDTVKRAAELLTDSALNYVGFVEGDDIYKGRADVIVCDGFAGNVALKSSEGVATMIARYMREEFERTPLSRLAGWVASPVLKALKRRIDPRIYNGATLIGLRGIVIKSHGAADAFAFEQAIRQATAEVRKNVPEMISAQLAPILRHREAV